MIRSIFRSFATGLRGAVGALGAGLSRPPREQVAALCYRKGADGLEILLVTSRDTGRWIVPKGWPIKSLPDSAAAAREAFEEAGVMGRVASEPIGAFGYRKRIGKGLEVPCLARLYPLEVETLADTYPEKKQRSRRWMSVEDASAQVDEPELKALIRSFSPG